MIGSRSQARRRQIPRLSHWGWAPATDTGRDCGGRAGVSEATWQGRDRYRQSVAILAARRQRSSEEDLHFLDGSERPVNCEAGCALEALHAQGRLPWEELGPSQRDR